MASLNCYCFWPWLTRLGITLGLIAGLIAVTCTESIGAALGITAWGRWPLTIHSAGWGIFFNLGIAILVSFFTQNSDELAHKMKFHNFLKEYAGLPSEKRNLIPIAWIITLLWFFFGIGPGAVIGNWVFGDPTNPDTWILVFPQYGLGRYYFGLLEYI